MKYACVILAASVGMLAACSRLNEFNPDKNTHLDEGKLVERIIFEVPPLRFLGEDGETRASLIKEGNDKLDFRWETTDTVGIYPDQGAQVFFSMAGGEGTNVASFDGGGWALRDNSTYFCYFPFVGNMYLDRNAIPVSFTNQEFFLPIQEQIDEQTEFLRYEGTRFYLASEGTSTPSGALSFSFKMLNTVIQINALGLPAGTYTKLLLSTDEPVFVQEGSFTLENMAITGNTYSNTLEVSLMDFTLTEATSEQNPVYIYLTSAPVDLSGKTVTIQIVSEDNIVYRCDKTPSHAYVAHSAGALKCEMAKESTIYYTSSDNNIVTPAYPNAFGGAKIVSNVYDGTRGILTFEMDVTEIGDHAFEGCETLTGITIPKTVTSIGKYAFSGCTNLAAGDTPATNMTRLFHAPISFRSDESSFVIPNTVTSIGDYAFQNCSSLTSITIPDNVETIGEGVFLGCTNLSSITLPDIDNDAIHAVFEGAGITSVTIAEGVTSIADNAFLRCVNLISVTLPSTLTNIGAHAFEDCSNLTDIIIPESVTYIGEAAFEGCVNLPRINLPSSTTIIRNFTFAGCNDLAEINIPSGLTYIGNSAFDCCHHLPNIVLPYTVTYIGTFAFASCRSFTTFSIPPGVTSILYGTFYECPNLSSIIIPESVTSIGSDAFNGCAGLSHITVHAVNPPEDVTESTFEGTNGCLIYVPSESLDTYKAATGWSNYADRICDHVYVEMGNGMRWATTNVGAIGPDDLGDCFAWGRTTPLTSPDRNYDRTDPFIDTAHEFWGGYWRMPTIQEWEELMNEDHYTWTWDPVRKGTIVESNVPGYVGNKIFLPAAGIAGMENDDGIFYIGEEGDYWAKSRRSEGTGWTLVVTPEGPFTGDYGFGAGLSVRPIFESNPVGNMENPDDSGDEVEI